MTPSAAILFFSRSAPAEALSKPLSGSYVINEKIAGTLISRTLSVIKKTSLPFFIIDETKQVGENFGERISNAIETVFNKGYKNVIVIGNDCPLLKPEQITAAQKLLETHSLALGKNNHGGAYLIGINKSGFKKETFAALRWQTAFLFNDLNNLLHGIILPDLLFDVNKKQDITVALKILSFTSFLHHLLQQTICNQFWFRKNTPINLIFASGYFSLRAPPGGLFQQL